MTDKHYHVYISTSYDDVKIERLKLENTLLNFGVFPWEFKERRTTLNTAQARRQIDDCDYVIFLLGGKYGDLSASGISYIHLDFLYALNKNKPIISFVDHSADKRSINERDVEPELLKKLASFRDMLQKDSQYYCAYNNLLDLERGIRNTFLKATQDSPALGWVRPQSNDVLHKEIQRLRQRVAELEQNLVQTKHEVVTSQVASSAPENQSFTISYRTHAYQDGNLKDIHPHREMSWLKILEVLASSFQQPTLENSFIRILNQYLEEEVALQDAREVLPRAHAVARTRIDSRCLQQIKLQMKWNNWIVPLSEMGSGTRVYWQITPDAERLLSSKK